MAFYMSQRVFNLTAFTMAWGQTLHFAGRGEDQKKETLDAGLASYRIMYPEDDFEPEMNRAVELVCSWSKDLDPDYKAQLQWVTSLMMAAQKYRTDGNRHPWRPFPFKGRWFSAPRSRPPDRYNQFVRDLGLYYLHIQTGRIPPHFLVEEGGTHTIKQGRP